MINKNIKRLVFLTILIVLIAPFALQAASLEYMDMCQEKRRKPNGAKEKRDSEMAPV